MSFLPLYAFSLAVVERLCANERGEHREFVLVHEKGDRGWWLPGGGVDYGETLANAAIRETKEEAGIDIELVGILRVEVSDRGGRLRVLYKGRPRRMNEPLKSVPDKETKGARWCSLKMCEMLYDHHDPFPDPETDLYLRGPEPLHWFTYIEKEEEKNAQAPMDFIINRNVDYEETTTTKGSFRCVSKTVQSVKVMIVDNVTNPTQFLLMYDDDKKVWCFPGTIVSDARIGFEMTARCMLQTNFKLKGIVQIEHYIRSRLGGSSGTAPHPDYPVRQDEQFACLRVCFVAAPRDAVETTTNVPNNNNQWRWVTIDDHLLSKSKVSKEDDHGFPSFDPVAAVQRVVSGNIQPLCRLVTNEHEIP